MLDGFANTRTLQKLLDCSGSALELRNLDVSRLVTGKNSGLSETEVADAATVYQLPKQLQMEHRVVESVLYSVAQ